MMSLLALHNRRHFIKSLLASSALATTPVLNSVVQAGAAVRPKLLICLQLAGGNDGLNTVIPWRDPKYKALRPRIAIAADQALRISDAAALHPAMLPLMSAWEAGELAVVEGVGYENPRRSHFYSTDVWQAGSTRPSEDGWLGSILAQSRAPDHALLDAVALDAEGEKVLRAPGLRTLTLQQPWRWLQRADALPSQRGRARGNKALAHLLEVEANIVAARGPLRRHLRSQKPIQISQASGKLRPSLRMATRLISGQFGLRALHLKLGGFDTHAGQPAAHARVLKSLAAGLSELRSALLQRGLWSDVLIMTYSEFGRRVAENASRGTDHGKAGPMLLLGKGVRGGLYGAAPNLVDLDAGDLRFAIPFARVYATVARDFMGLPASAVASVLGQHRSLPLIA